MVSPFLVEYGKEFGDSAYTDDEAAKQLAVYGEPPAGGQRAAQARLRRVEDAQSWADPTTGLAPGALVPRHRLVRAWRSCNVLDAIPANHPRRAQLLGDLELGRVGLRSYQDPKTGRWFQVIDKGSRADNWTETSCSSMFTYALARGRPAGLHRPALRGRGPNAATRACSPRSRSARTAGRTCRHLDRHQCRRLRLLHRPHPGHQRLPRPRRLPDHERTAQVEVTTDDSHPQGPAPGRTGRRRAAAGLPGAGAHAASWQQRWAPSEATDGLKAFETIEGDRAELAPRRTPPHTPRR